MGFFATFGYWYDYYGLKKIIWIVIDLGYNNIERKTKKHVYALWWMDDLYGSDQ